MDQDLIILSVDDTEEIIATVSPSNASDNRVTWSSDNEDVATVEDGVVTAVGPGTAIITVTSFADSSKKATVHVVVGDLLVPAGGSIQEVINAAEKGYVIVVAPAEYKEQLVIDKALTLLGPNAGIAGTGVRNAEATITYPDAPVQDAHSTVLYKVLEIKADDVTISGFAFDDDNFSYAENENAYTTGIHAHGSNVEITNTILEGFTYPQLRITSSFWDTEKNALNYHDEYVHQALVEGNWFRDSISPYAALYIQGTSGVVRNNTLENVVGMQIQPYHNPVGGLVENNSINAFRRGIWHNGAYLGAGTWEFKGNEVRAVEIPSDFPNSYVVWEGLTVETFGDGGSWQTGAPPSVAFENNTIDGSGASPQLATVGLSMRQPVNELAVATFTNNTFENVDIGADDTNPYAGWLDLGLVLENNTFPAGSISIGNQIKVFVPEEGKVYNKRTGQDYATIQDAVNAANEDDTILVGPGTYTVNIVININKNLTITGEEGVIFESTGTNSILQPSNGAKLTISDVEFKGTVEGREGQQRGIDMVANTEVVVTGCTFDTLRGGLYANPGAMITVTGSTFTNVLAGIGTDTAAENLNISGNTFVELGEAVGFTAPRDTEANFLALKADIIDNNTGATEGNVTAYGTFMGDLTEYNALLAAVVEEDYTTASWEAYQAIVEENQVTGASSQREIDIAIVNIKYAQMDLILATVKNTSQDLYYASIQDAINAATTGDNIIAVYPGDYGDEPIEIVQKEGVNITLAAVGEVVLKNQIKIDGDARSEGQDYVSIKGFTFDFSDATGGIITTAKIDSPNYVYAHNIFIEDCVFIGNSDNVVAVRADAQGGHYNFLLKGCTGTNLHSLAQLTGVTGVTVQDCNVLDAIEGGLNLQHSTDIEITNLTVEASMDVNSYGVRAGQNTDSPVNESNTMTISNSNFEAKHPIWLRGDAPGTVIITDSTLTASEDGEMIYNDANGTVNITIDEAAYVTSEEELKTALANTSVKGIILGDDIELTEYVNLNNNKGLVLDGNGQTITTVYDGRNPCGLYLASDNITIKNVTITGESKVGIDTKRGTKGLSIIDVTFKGMGIGFYANPDVEGTIEKCIFEYLGTGIGINGSSFSTVDNSFSNIINMYLEIFGERTEEDINEILGDNTFDSEVEAVFEESKWTIIAKTIKNNNLKAFTMGFVALEEETQTTAEEETLDTVSAFNEAATEEEENAGEETEDLVNEQEVEDDEDNDEEQVDTVVGDDNNLEGEVEPVDEEEVA